MIYCISRCATLSLAFMQKKTSTESTVHLIQFLQVSCPKSFCSTFAPHRAPRWRSWWRWLMYQHSLRQNAPFRTHVWCCGGRSFSFQRTFGHADLVQWRAPKHVKSCLWTCAVLEGSFEWECVSFTFGCPVQEAKQHTTLTSTGHLGHPKSCGYTGHEWIPQQRWARNEPRRGTPRYGTNPRSEANREVNVSGSRPHVSVAVRSTQEARWLSHRFLESRRTGAGDCRTFGWVRKAFSVWIDAQWISMVIIHWSDLLHGRALHFPQGCPRKGRPSSVRSPIGYTWCNPFRSPHQASSEAAPSPATEQAMRSFVTSPEAESPEMSGRSY